MTLPPAGERPRRVLTIAGSDSGGGAGIQADLKTFAAHGVYGLSAVTAVTAQNTREVRAVAAVAPAMVAAQIDAVLDDFGADAVKIGMLWSADTVRAVAARLRAHLGAAPAPGRQSRPSGEAAAAGGRPVGRLPVVPIVLDPVMAAESGAPLLDAAAAEAVLALIEELLPMATLVTPNLPELERLAEALRPRAAALGSREEPAPPAAPAASLGPAAGGPPVGEAARLAMARLLAARGPAVLAKGGHDLGPGAGEVVDLLLIGGTPGAGAPTGGGRAGRGDPSQRNQGAECGERVVRFAGPRLPTRATHGTGCTLSAAVAARLATGEELAAAVGGAIEYVRRAMQAAPPLGGGPSPLAHFV
jgi:hydroxymethylpyrimidine/phosphomethylpyrimidine kinase